jgi:hypothetical protein
MCFGLFCFNRLQALRVPQRRQVPQPPPERGAKARRYPHED